MHFNNYFNQTADIEDMSQYHALDGHICHKYLSLSFLLALISASSLSG